MTKSSPLLPVFILCAVSVSGQFPHCTLAAPAIPKSPVNTPNHEAKKSKSQGDHDKSYLLQSSVASKKPFATIPAASPAVTKALDAKALDMAQKQIGRIGAFQGTVSKVYSPRGHDIVILDFAPNYDEALTAVVKPAAYAKFPDLTQLEGKRVLISGKFVAYHESPQIEMTSPAQVKVIP